jgi:hypothetical protein
LFFAWFEKLRLNVGRRTMSVQPRVVFEPPNVENTIPVQKYRSSSPETFSLAEDNMVLYGGGDGFTMEVLRNDPARRVELVGEIAEGPCSVYVLNTCLLIWFRDRGSGVELPYQCISLHALQDDHLYLQVAANTFMRVIATDGRPAEENYVELMLRRCDEPAAQSPLFEGSSSALQLFEAMSKCSAFHLDDDSDDDQPRGAASNGGWHTGDTTAPNVEVPAAWLNRGDADDLDDGLVPEGGAGMDVDVGYGPLAGTVRKSSEDCGSQTKRRR